MKQGTASFPEEDFRFLDGNCLEPLRGGSLFITGGTGFVGSWLLEYLLRKDRELALGLSVRVLSRDPGRFLAANPHFAHWPALNLVTGDVRDLAPDSIRADWVIHGATAASRQVNESTPLEMLDVVVKGMEAVLAAAGSCKRFLFLSSGLACGSQPRDLEAMGEDQMGHLDSLDPNGAYGNAKHFAEHLCLQHGRARGFEVAIARCYAFAGPLLPLDAHFALGNFIRDGLGGVPIRIQGDGTPLRTYLHAVELAHWLWVLLTRGAPGRAYNVGGGEPVSIRELAEHIGNHCGVPVEVAQAPQPGVLPSRYVPSIARAREELGLQPLLSWREAVDRTIRWHQAVRNGMEG